LQQSKLETRRSKSRGKLKALASPFSKLSSKFASEEVDENALFMMAFLYAISTAKPARDELFRVAGEKSNYGFYTEIMNKIYMVGAKWKYGLNKACEFFANEVKNKFFRDFLTRFAQVLSLGEDTESFLQSELQVALTDYVARYERILESLKLLLGIYSTLMSTSTFMVVNIVILAMLWGGEMVSSMIFSAYLGVTFSLLSLILVCYKVFPRDKLLNDMKKYLPEYRTYKLTAVISIASASIAFVSLYKNFPIGFTLILTGVPFIMPGLLARKIEHKVRDVDIHYPVFIRSLGRTLAVVPLLKYAVQALLRTEFGKLTPLIRRLYKRLVSNIERAVAWEYFTFESGSELVNRINEIFSAAMERGGDMMAVGNYLSDISSKLLELRKRRLQISKAFESTTILLHMLAITIAVFISNLVELFSSFLVDIQTVFPITQLPPELIELLTLLLALSLTVLNSLMIKVSQGGAYETYWFSLGILLILTGMVISGLDYFSETFFQSILQPASEIIKI